MDRCDRGLDGVGTEPARREGSLDQFYTLRDQRTIPARAVLVFQKNESSLGRRARSAPRFVQQHQGKEPDHFRFRQECEEQPTKSDRFARKISSRKGFS